MTALGLRYLMGFAVSADSTRQKPEFPPDPGRVFMAMAAAHFETRGDAAERTALEWLEQQSSAPFVSAPEFSLRRASSGRLPLETYVPVNDKHGGIKGRSRQARSFPTVKLYDDLVFLLWDTDPTHAVRTALDQLCSKVTRIGHSSSLVQMWVVDSPEEIKPNMIPDDFASEKRMRVAEAGTLAYLESAFEKAERPRLARWQGYRQATSENATPVTLGVFDPRLIVFEKREGRVLGLESTLQLTSALRNAAMKALPNNESPEWLTGHQPDGSPTLQPHVAFLPLPFVSAPYADGHVLGMAMAIPWTISSAEARRVIGPLLFDPKSGEERIIRLWSSTRFWEWSMQRETRDRPPNALLSDTWTKASRVWASVTPVVLHHYPKRKRTQDIGRILLDAFASAGLPTPNALKVQQAPIFKGAPNSQSMPNFSEGGSGLCRYQVHVTVEFENPVQGPVLVGRGRYRGYGMFRPLKSKQERGNE